MTKEELTILLRSVGCPESTISAMENAFEMGVEHEREKQQKFDEELLMYAGVSVWIGKTKTQFLVTQQELIQEEFKGMALRNAAQKCLDTFYSNITGKA